MDIWVTSQTRQTKGTEIRINCPCCGCRDTPASTLMCEEGVGIFFIPLLTQKHTYVRCSHCNTRLVSELSLLELPNYSAEELEPFVKFQLSFVTKALAIISVVFACLPFVSLPIAIYTLVMSNRYGGWPKWISVAGIILSTIMSIWLIFSLIIK